MRTGVHEYGGGSYCIHEGVAFVSNFDDQRLYRIDPGAEPVPITPAVEEKRHRYADGRITHDGVLWIGVRERHAESDRSSDVVNELVALPTDGSAEPAVIASGRDFYSNPRVSPDGTRLCFLAWDLPWMPWDGCELHVADLVSDGTLTNVQEVAGRIGVESIWQPAWSPSGDLVFASDRSGWWNLERVRDGERGVLHAAEAEFGYPAWVFGTSSYAVPSGRTNRLRVRPRRADLFRRARPRHWRARGSRRAARCLVGRAIRRRRRLDGRVPRRVGHRTRGDRRARSRRGHLRGGPHELRGARRSGVPLRPRVDRVPDGGRSQCVRAVLRADKSGRRCSGGRASAAARHEPRWADRERDGELRPRDPVLDEPRFRGRGRQLRRLDRLRPRIPRAPERRVGGRRSSGLPERRPLPRRAR